MNASSGRKLFARGLPWLGVLLAAFGGLHGAEPTDLERGFAQPPPKARLRAYWWWLNGNVTKAAITRDLEGMKAQGFGGAILCDADGSNQDGNARAPHGPTFFSPEWRELYKHTLREAARLGLEMSLNIQSGWNLGGPMIKPEDAPKKLVWSETRVQAGQGTVTLPEPKHAKEFYRDVAVVAYPARPDAQAHPPLKNFGAKALEKSLGMSAPDTHLFFEELPEQPGDVDALSTKVSAGEGALWTAPPVGLPGGAREWVVLRFGCTLNDHCRVSTASEGWDGYALDPYDEKAFRAYWTQIVEPLIADAGPLAGKTLRYLHTDSWEVETSNWTPGFQEEFKQRRGYDPLAYLPVFAGKIIDSRNVSNRFLADWRKTMGDLAVDHHYKPFLELAHRHGLEIHPESGGPHASPFDAQRCLGMSDAPMSEFWSRSPRHRTTDAERFFVKQPASAAHTYGKKLVVAEGFTNIGMHWQETVWENLKSSFDYAICEGLNRLVWHAFVCSPDETGTPGQQYFAGTHFDPKTTWFSRSGGFLTYINRCQFMMQQGLPVADVLYYYGDHVPNFAQLRASDPAQAGAVYDYDVATEEVILKRLGVRDGRLVLPGGMSYAVLVLPDYPALSLPVLRKVRELAEAGATIIGQPPLSASGLPVGQDEEAARLAEDLWGRQRVIRPAPTANRHLPPDRTVPEALARLGSPPDFEAVSPPESERIRYAHRRDGDTDIYFVCNPLADPITIRGRFRVTGKKMELWNPVTGEIRKQTAFRPADKPGITETDLEFVPYGSWFVVFREKGEPPKDTETANFRASVPAQELAGPWTVRFNPKWGGPESVTFDALSDWTKRREEGIRYYAGTATYEKTFDLPAPPDGKRRWLDLGEMHEIADVRLNGKPLGNVWAKPFRVDITDAVRPKDNRLEIDVTNFWANRVIGDQSLPEPQRLTRTNIRKLTKSTPLMPAGLIGPVRIMVEAAP